MSEYSEGYIFSDKARKYAQQGFAFSSGSLTHCDICRNPFTESNRPIKSHSVSKSTLKILAGSSLEVNSFNIMFAIGTDRNLIRTTRIGAAGIGSYAHKDCDMREFEAYENKGIISNEAAFSLIRKTLFSEKVRIRKRDLNLISQNQKMNEDTIGIIIGIEKLLGLNGELSIPCYKEAALELAEMYDYTTSSINWITQMIDKLSIDDVWWKCRIVRSTIPIAFQGVLKRDTEHPIFVAYLPRDENSASFFLSVRKDDPDKEIFMQMPIGFYMHTLALREDCIFWRPGAISDPLVQSLYSMHNDLGPAKLYTGSPSRFVIDGIIDSETSLLNTSLYGELR